MTMRTLLIWLACGLAILLVVFLVQPLLHSSSPAYRQADSLQLVYLLVYAFMISAGLWATLRRRGEDPTKQGWKFLRYAGIWLAIGGAAALLYMVIYYKG
ncbi:MAG: hypothetical protein ABI740_06675 [Alphaproteobacteria bacterium]